MKSSEDYPIVIANGMVVYFKKETKSEAFAAESYWIHPQNTGTLYKPGNILCFADGQDGIKFDFVDFEDVEELVPHFDELILGGIVGGKPGDGGHGREEFVGLFYSFDVVDICFADFSFLFGIDY